jgi:hypothetical protein
MSNRNDSEAAIGLVIFAAIVMVGIFLFFVAALVSLFLTIVCIFAWNEEREIFGETLMPQEARGFIIAGIIGAVVVGVFGAFMYENDMLLEDNRGWMPLIGYVFGSLSWAVWYAKQPEEEEQRRARAPARKSRANPHGNSNLQAGTTRSRAANAEAHGTLPIRLDD